MDERQKKFLEYEKVLQAIESLKALEIPYQQERTPDGEIYTWCEYMPGLWGVGKNSEESLTDMVRAFYEGAEIMRGEIWNYEPVKQIYTLKILISTPGEILKCLRGRN